MLETENLRRRLRQGVTHFWKTRQLQLEKQKTLGRQDQGARSAVTGGAQMNGFIELITELVEAGGVPRECIHYNRSLELPGFFRPTKEWDFLVIKDGQLLVALETKSQVGPSFGNNFNNRTEEAMGSALDLWTAFREGAFNKTIRPWLGYFFLLEECKNSMAPVKVQEPHFKVFPEFKQASYAMRYQLFCRKLVRERHYTAAAFMLSNFETGPKGEYKEPAEDITFEIFARSLLAHVAAQGGKILP